MSDINNLYNNLTNFYNVNDENFKEFMAKLYDEMLANHKDVKYVKEHYIEEIEKKLKEYIVDGAVPVFGSGDLFTPEDAKRMLSETGCDGIMFARGAMGNPFIFSKTVQLLKNGFYDEIPVLERIKTGFKELEMLCDDSSEESACREMRKRFCAYSKGISGGAELRAKIIHASTVQDYKEIFKDFEQ